MSWAQIIFLGARIARAGELRFEVMHPGPGHAWVALPEASVKTLRPEEDDGVGMTPTKATLAVPLKQGCAMVRVVPRESE